MAGRMVAEAIRGTASRFDLFAGIKPSGVPRRSLASHAAAGHGDGVVPDFGTSLREAPYDARMKVPARGRCRAFHL